MNWEGKPFGYDRWKMSIAEKMNKNTPVFTVSSLFDDMRRHADGRSVDDDLTILILQNINKQSEHQ